MAGRTFTLDPKDAPKLGGTGLVPKDVFQYTNNAQGYCIVSNVVEGWYLVQLNGPQTVTPFMVNVPPYVGLLNATNLLKNASKSPGVQQITSTNNTLIVSPSYGIGAVNLEINGTSTSTLQPNAGTNITALTNFSTVTISAQTDTNVVNILISNLVGTVNSFIATNGGVGTNITLQFTDPQGNPWSFDGKSFKSLRWSSLIPALGFGSDSVTNPVVTFNGSTHLNQINTNVPPLSVTGIGLGTNLAEFGVVGHGIAAYVDSSGVLHNPGLTLGQGASVTESGTGGIVFSNATKTTKIAGGVVYADSFVGSGTNLTGIATSNQLASDLLSRQDNYRGPTGLQTVPDVWYDCDPNEDWGKLFTLTTLLALHQRGEINLIAITVQSTNWFSAPSFESILRYYGFDRMPIASANPTTLVRNPTDSWGLYVATNYFNMGGVNVAYSTATSFIRRLLASRPDHSVVAFWEGQLENPYDIFNSAPDSSSSLTGAQLLQQKLLYIGAVCGVYPYGYEGNLYYSPAKAQLVNELTNIPVVWTSGTGGDPNGTGAFSWSDQVMIGSNFWANLSYDNPVRWAALNYHSAHVGIRPFEPAWAPLMALYIGRGANSQGVNWFGLQTGSNYVTASGSNVFNTAVSTVGGQAYLTPTLTYAQYSAAIEALMYQNPIAGRIQAAPAWSPRSLRGLDMWLEADSTTPAFASGAQQQYGLDLSGVSGQINFSGVSGKVPLLIQNAVNGHPAWLFSTATQTTWSSPTVDSSVSPFYVAAVIYCTNTSPANAILGGGAGRMSFRVFNGRLDLVSADNYTLGASAAGSIQPNAWYLAEALCDANGNTTFWTNGISCGSASNAVSLSSSFGSYIGSEEGTKSPFGGYIAAVLKTHTLPTAADQRNLRAWWNSIQKWAIYTDGAPVNSTLTTNTMLGLTILGNTTNATRTSFAQFESGQGSSYDTIYPVDGRYLIAPQILTFEDGAMFQLYGGQEPHHPGNVYLDYGSLSNAIPTRTFHLRQLDGASNAFDVVTADANSNVTITGTAIVGGRIVANLNSATNLPISGITNIGPRGTIIYQGASGLSTLTPGLSGQALVTAGTGADPFWGSATNGGFATNIIYPIESATIGQTTNGQTVAPFIKSASIDTNLFSASAWAWLTTLGNSNSLWLNASNLVFQGTNGLATGAFTSSNTLWLSASNLTWQSTNALATGAFTPSNTLWLSASNLVFQGTNGLTTGAFTPSNTAWLNSSNLVFQGTNGLATGAFTSSNSLWLSASNLAKLSLSTADGWFAVSSNGVYVASRNGFAVTNLQTGALVGTVAPASMGTNVYLIAGNANVTIATNYSAGVHTYTISVGTGGTVTSVGLTAPTGFSVSGGPVTTSGTLAISFTTENPNAFLVGPTSGGAASPTWRTVVPSDLMSADAITNGQTTAALFKAGLMLTNPATGSFLRITNDSILSSNALTGNFFYLTNDSIQITNRLTGKQAVITNGTFYGLGQNLTNSSGAGANGTVTSVSETAPPWFTITGVPITGSGTIAFTNTVGVSPTNFNRGEFWTNINTGASFWLGTNGHITSVDQFGNLLSSGTNWFTYTMTNGTGFGFTNGTFYVNSNLVFSGSMSLAQVTASSIYATNLTGGSLVVSNSLYVGTNVLGPSNVFQVDSIYRTNAFAVNTNGDARVSQTLTANGITNSSVTSADALATDANGKLIAATAITEAHVSGLPADLSQKVLTNDSRSLVLSSATNNLGTDVSATRFWGDGSHLSGVAGGSYVTGAGVALTNSFSSTNNFSHYGLTETNDTTHNWEILTNGGFFTTNAVTGAWTSQTNDSITLSNLQGFYTTITNGALTLTNRTAANTGLRLSSSNLVIATGTVGSNMLYAADGTTPVTALTNGGAWFLNPIIGNISQATNNLTSQSANYSIAAGDFFVLLSGAHTATLPTAVGIPGKAFTILCSSAGTNAILTTSAQTISGATKWTNTAVNKFTTVVSDNANWWVVNQN